MKVLKNSSKLKKVIHIGKIKPFKNICRVTKVSENCNVEMTYIPNKHLVELGSYREFFKQPFNLYIEDLAELVFNEIKEKAKPKYLKVTVYLEDKKLTPWDVTIETK